MSFYLNQVEDIVGASEETNSAVKGRLFEKATCEIFESIIDIRVYRSNIVVSDGSQEIDIVLVQDLPTRLWFTGHAFFVECKCTKNRVSSKEVSYFGEKLVTAGINFGVIFFLTGITGVDRNAAHAVILRYKERGVHIVSLRVSELTPMQNFDALIDLMIAKRLALLAGVVE